MPTVCTTSQTLNTEHAAHVHNQRSAQEKTKQQTRGEAVTASTPLRLSPSLPPSPASPPSEAGR